MLPHQPSARFLQDAETFGRHLREDLAARDRPLCELDYELLNLQLRHRRADDPGETKNLAQEITRVVNEIDATPPKSFDDCLVKLRRLADPDSGIAASESEMLSLHQLIDFIEAQASSARIGFGQ